MTALLSPIIFVPVLTFAFGRQKYDWVSMKMIPRVDDSEIIRRTSVASGTADPELVPGSEAARSQATEDAEVAHLNKVAKIARPDCLHDSCASCALANAALWLKIRLQQEVLHRYDNSL